MAKILIVDDDARTRQLYVALLTPFGHEVMEAGDGEEGLRRAQGEKFDLVISDILMPTMSGYEFVPRLRQLPACSKVPVIFQSATFLSHQSRALGQACGVSLFISKPSEPEKILAVVHAALGLAPAVPAMPPPAEARGDPVPLLLEAFFQKGQELDAASVRLASLLELGLELAHPGSLRELLEKAGNAARKIIGANYSAIGILGPDGVHPRTVACFGTNDAVAKKLEDAAFDGPHFHGDRT